MSGEAKRDGAIVVVEDQVYIGADTARALQGAGAHAVGTLRTEKAARSALYE